MSDFCEDGVGITDAVSPAHDADYRPDIVCFLTNEWPTTVTLQKNQMCV